MPKTKKKFAGQQLKDIKDLLPTGFDSLSDGDNREELEEQLKKDGFTGRRIEKYYNTYYVLPEIGDIICYWDLHRYTRVVIGLCPGTGFEFETVSYTSSKTFKDVEDLIENIDLNSEVIMHVRDFRPKYIHSTSWRYTKEASTYIDPMGH